ncbi:Type IV secretion-system coupling protein DNA-binding domain-containing protein [Daejeonella rubra]|uniref:Type IV secretion-system coupling protein DNA-binding domain-containing protein n=1 Tax=Daejeonella rubra TaxID=990371 RepID=A0A1G9NIZ3_9SPHI|nr:TraM recognition domain-containing protein [Daejeonella rubra]SDL86303.1 Type IV secretion-system coupling protein DNA-binding domain-containing protein [Daejeonella rubra]
MEETKEQQSLHRFLQFGIYLSVVFDVLLFVYARKITGTAISEHYGLSHFLERMAKIIIYKDPLNSRLFTLILICLVSVGTLSRKKKDLNPKNSIVYPLTAGLLIFIGGLWFYGKSGGIVFPHTNWYDIGYITSAFLGAIVVHIAMDNVSKIISSNLGKDKWNVEGESFMQATKPKLTPYAVNIPTLFYYKKKVRKGYIVLENVFRGTLLCGVPGSGKSFGVVMPVIRQFMALEFTLCLYDFKFPDLGKVAYYHYLLAKQKGKCRNYEFHVVNLSEPEKSRRVNPWRAAYLSTLADASETAEGLVEAMKKGDKSGGSDQFFTQSAINFLASCIYFFSKYNGGQYSSFPHVLAFLNLSYEDIFSTLFSNKELASLLSPFMTAYKARAFDQLEGQVGTLKIFISRLATKETFWVFSGDDFDLKISDQAHPGVLVLANDPNTQSINSACYSVILNRITRLVNSRGNIPVGLVIDEAPTLYCHKIENLIAQARSNLTAVLLGLQELPQLKQQYGKETAATITAVVGNVLSGSVRNKETLEWLERLFGKVKQLGESLSIDRTKTSVSLNEKLEPLIPAGKIASLKAGEMVGILAADAVEKFTGQYETSAVNCRINLDLKAIKKEEQAYRELPFYYDFKGRKEEVLLQNFNKINCEVQEMVRQFKPMAAPQPAPTSKGSMKPGFKK